MRKGFTLIEVLIVIVVIAILAAIIVPRVWINKRAKSEATLRVCLQEMRNAIGLFYAQCGDYPSQLYDLVADTPPMIGGNGKQINHDDFRGPYMGTEYPWLPINPITGGNVEGVDWIYNPKTGEVRAKSGTALDGSDYDEW